MICPRCADAHIELMATSPVKGVWTVYQCQHCLYTWRDTEPLRRTSREHYPQAFRMTQVTLNHATARSDISTQCATRKIDFFFGC
ncbi:non-oxidative hydroxyarylic acid decarboxylases subunit D [Salmonella enterica]|uniref:non-oxidative hydroxyarylic acid decarboxylases subunit D n=1 Tax=Salmonella enterica TaxID=28901 RepID=UPI0035C19C12